MKTMSCCHPVETLQPHLQLKCCLIITVPPSDHNMFSHVSFEHLCRKGPKTENVFIVKIYFPCIRACVQLLQSFPVAHTGNYTVHTQLCECLRTLSRCNKHIQLPDCCKNSGFSAFSNSYLPANTNSMHIALP